MTEVVREVVKEIVREIVTKGYHMKKLAPLLATLVIPTAALATNVAVVDSGTFFAHEKIRDHVWTNPGEIDGNMVDDDHNGKVDDIHGWNFAENLPKVFYPEHISDFSDGSVFKIFHLLAKIQAKKVTPEEKEWWKEHIQNLPKPQKDALLGKLNYYGQYAHSTHVSGIIAMGNPAAKIMSARIFPDTQLPASAANTEGLIYEALAALSNKQFAEVAHYLHETKMPVANYSVGVPMSQIAKNAMGIMGNKNPTPEQIATESKRAFEAFERQGKQWIASAPETLFVIAAANDGADNAILPVFPANIHADNAITVAATDGYLSLADFSNWDTNTVQVAAPGVAIVSSVPGPTATEMVPMSGTSMAAPFVSMVASSLKEANVGLTPIEMRSILIGTVDKKAWLATKVSSSGIVNKDRAVRAATLASTMTLDAAIQQARTEIADMPEVGSSVDFNPTETATVEPTREMLNWAQKLAQ